MNCDPIRRSLQQKETKPCKSSRGFRSLEYSLGQLT